MEYDWPKRNKSHYVTEIVSWLEFADVIFDGDKRQPEIRLRSQQAKENAAIDMVGEMVQNSQSLYSFTFNVVIIIHEYIYSHSTTKFIFKKYINSHLTTYFVFTNISTHIYGMYSFTFNGIFSFTFTIEILVQHGAIFIQHFLRTAFAHH